MCNNEYFVCAIRNEEKILKGGSFSAVLLFAVSLLAHVTSRRGRACRWAFGTMSQCRQWCLVSHESMQCDSYNYDSMGSFPSHQVIFSYFKRPKFDVARSYGDYYRISFVHITRMYVYDHFFTITDTCLGQ